MYGFYIFELQVFVRRGDQDVPVWNLVKEQGDFWAQHSVTIEDLSPDVKVSSGRGAGPRLNIKTSFSVMWMPSIEIMSSWDLIFLKEFLNW